MYLALHFDHDHGCAWLSKVGDMTLRDTVRPLLSKHLSLLSWGALNLQKEELLGASQESRHRVFKFCKGIRVVMHRDPLLSIHNTGQQQNSNTGYIKCF